MLLFLSIILLHNIAMWRGIWKFKHRNVYFVLCGLLRKFDDLESYVTFGFSLYSSVCMCIY